MDKKVIHYLAGLPRSGNTLLSSILNQNPKIYSSPQSPVINYMWAVAESARSEETSILFNNQQRLDQVLKSIPKNFYEDVKEPVIFDRSKVWGTPGNLNLLLRLLNDSPKIIFTVRPLLDILSSWTRMFRKYPYLDEEMFSSNLYASHYLPLEDARCEFIMSGLDIMSKPMYALNNLMKQENRKHVLFVDYDRLTSVPQVVLDEIHEYIGLDSFDYDFSNIVSIDKGDYSSFPFPPELHLVKQSIHLSYSNFKDVLSEYVVNKYLGDDFWTGRL